MSNDEEFVLIEGERRPRFNSGDAYLMAVLWFGEPGSLDGCINFLCDSHYGLRRLRQVFEKVASGSATKPFSIQLLATPDLTAFVETKHHEGCVPTLASQLDVFPSDERDLFSLEYAGKQTLELYIGQDHAQSFREDLDRFEDTYRRDREIYIAAGTKMMEKPPKKDNALPSVFFVTAVWPGLHKTPENALRYELNQLYLKYWPGENDTADKIESYAR